MILLINDRRFIQSFLYFCLSIIKILYFPLLNSTYKIFLSKHWSEDEVLRIYFGVVLIFPLPVLLLYVSYGRTWVDGTFLFTFSSSVPLFLLCLGPRHRAHTDIRIDESSWRNRTFNPSPPLFLLSLPLLTSFFSLSPLFRSFVLSCSLPSFFPSLPFFSSFPLSRFLSSFFLPPLSCTQV